MYLNFEILITKLSNEIDISFFHYAMVNALGTIVTIFNHYKL